jgi:hypothetical protein
VRGRGMEPKVHQVRTEQNGRDKQIIFHGFPHYARRFSIKSRGERIRMSAYFARDLRCLSPEMM